MEQAIEAGDAVTVALLLHAGEPANSLMSGRCTPLYRAAEKGGTAMQRLWPRCCGPGQTRGVTARSGIARPIRRSTPYSRRRGRPEEDKRRASPAVTTHGWGVRLRTCPAYGPEEHTNHDGR
jgi:hypothetical protein